MQDRGTELPPFFLMLRELGVTGLSFLVLSGRVTFTAGDVNGVLKPMAKQSEQSPKLSKVSFDERLLRRYMKKDKYVDVVMFRPHASVAYVDGRKLLS